NSEFWIARQRLAYVRIRPVSGVRWYQAQSAYVVEFFPDLYSTKRITISDVDRGSPEAIVEKATDFVLQFRGTRQDLTPCTERRDASPVGIPLRDRRRSRLSLAGYRQRRKHQGANRTRECEQSGDNQDQASHQR